MLTEVVFFTAAVGAVACQVLRAMPEVKASCGQNVSLMCDASSPNGQNLNIKLFSWLGNETTLCQFKAEPTGAVCESTGSGSHYSLTLHLLNLTLSNQGEYLCKLQSTIGVKHVTTVVKVQDCLQSKSKKVNSSQLKCWFYGVYPSGTVHWFQEHLNMTDQAETTLEEKSHGSFDVVSILNLKTLNKTGPCNCSLWIPSEGKYLSTQQLTSGQSQSSTISLQQVTAAAVTLVFLEWI